MLLGLEISSAHVFRLPPSKSSRQTESRKVTGGIMFLALFFVFLVCWIFGWVVFHVAGGLIHALLVVAVISLVWHFVRDRAAV